MGGGAEDVGESKEGGTGGGGGGRGAEHGGTVLSVEVHMAVLRLIVADVYHRSKDDWESPDSTEGRELTAMGEVVVGAPPQMLSPSLLTSQSWPGMMKELLLWRRDYYHEDKVLMRDVALMEAGGELSMIPANTRIRLLQLLVDMAFDTKVRWRYRLLA